MIETKHQRDNEKRHTLGNGFEWGNNEDHYPPNPSYEGKVNAHLQ
jgi:hypothetical protein